MAGTNAHHPCLYLARQLSPSMPQEAQPHPHPHPGSPRAQGLAWEALGAGAGNGVGNGVERVRTLGIPCISCLFRYP